MRSVRSMQSVKAMAIAIALTLSLPGVAVMSGCGRSSSDGPYVDLPDSATVVSVNGACYAKSYVEQNVTVMANLMVLAGARTEDLEMTVDPIGYRFRLMNSMVERELLIQESAKRGISLDEGDVRRRENQLAAEFTRFARICFRLAPLPEPSSVWPICLSRCPRTRSPPMPLGWSGSSSPPRSRRPRCDNFAIMSS